MENKKTRKSFAPAKLILSVAVALGSSSAFAFRIDTGSPDASLNWDTTLRYNAGWRLEDINPHFANAFGTDESETIFKKHDLVLNRLDIFTEADYAVKTGDYKYGVRVSAGAWSEHAYPDHAHTGDLINSTFGAAAPPSNYGAGGRWSANAKRFSVGSSGEIVDAFVFGGLPLRTTRLDVKVGQHNIFWGESFILAQNSVAHMQGPTNSAKGLMSPGLDAKESFMPLNRISAVWNLSNAFALVGEYTLDWKPGRGPSAGTYFSSSDVTDSACARVFAGGTPCIRLLDPVTPGRGGGDYGIALRWNPSFAEGSAGFYYRKYDEKTQWGATQIDATGPGGARNPGNIGVRFVYPRDTELYGVSYSTRIGTVSTGMELSYRRNAALSGSGGTAILPLTRTPSYEDLEGARGNTYHFVINGIYLLPANPWVETGNVLAEVGYVRLDKVTKNPSRFNGEGFAGCAAGLTKGDGCATKDNLTATLRFSPQWFGVLPSVDLTVPISVTYSISGNNPTNGTADNEGLYSWSIGVTAAYKTVYEFGLTINDRSQHYSTKTSNGSDGVPGATIINTANGPLAEQNNHRWVNLRFKTTF